MVMSQTTRSHVFVKKKLKMILMNFSRTKNLRTERKQENVQQTFSKTAALSAEKSQISKAFEPKI